MNIRPLRKDIRAYIKNHALRNKWEKVSNLFERDMRHPSLHTELLEPHWHGIYSFRLNKRYRALFFIGADGVAEVFKVTDHYKK